MSGYRRGRARRWAQRTRELREREGMPRRRAFVAADACRRCGGIGTVRIRTGNGGQRGPCSECGGTGQMLPGPR